MWWTISFLILGLFLFFRFFVWFTGNWRATLNRVITQYVAWKQMEPGYSDKEVFIAVLDHRYPEPKKDIGGLRAKMFLRKNQIKKEMEVEIDGGISVLDKYSLPILIYACLFIEENSYLKRGKSIGELLEPIRSEVIRQGFEKYV